MSDDNASKSLPYLLTPNQARALLESRGLLLDSDQDEKKNYTLIQGLVSMGQITNRDLIRILVGG
jgi:hypothetical protein|tara:strand:+ start:297 stop:491 length:195 start_codon:yes stop_codon:yes gene_type:complete